MKHLFKVRVVVFILSALPLAFLDVSTVTAQFACAPHDNQSLAHFPQFPPVGTSSYIGEVVYQFDNIPDGDEKNQIISALNSWNLSLASTCSGVFFTTTPSQADYGVLAFQNGTLTDGSAGNALRLHGGGRRMGRHNYVRSECEVRTEPNRPAILRPRY